jgi:Anaphase-promoting complex, subunit 10 (APC10)
MRKSIVSPSAVAATPISDLWRDLERIARVEISSEDPQFPIEHALGKKVTTGWRAAGTGPQLIRLHFDEPLNIKRLQLHFVDNAAERSQEFAVYAGTGPELKEVVRQQWSFSPRGSTEEIEDYTVNLSGITTLEVRIDPDRSHDPKQSQHYASLQSLKLA